MADIVLSTFNARYVHASLGLRYLLANLGPLRERAALLEFDLDCRPVDAAELILAQRPQVVGFGVYVWNVTLITDVVSLLKRLRPELCIVLGGPEVSCAGDLPPVAAAADCVLAGEAELAFARLCHHLLDGGEPPARFIEIPPPNLEDVVLPYDLYSDADLAQRLTYIEASRGCPFACEYCLSGSDERLRRFPLPAVMSAWERLLARGARRWKFVDRSVNADLELAETLVNFFTARARTGLEIHFEMVPGRFPESLLAALARAPAGMLRLEVGVQTLNPDVAARIRRRQEPAKVVETLRRLRRETGARLHVDLIAGLPGEGMESFGRGFDHVVATGAQEIQLGILKRLRGAAIGRHDAAWGMVYAEAPPYEVLQTGALSFGELQRLRRVARFWELLGNRGRFPHTLPLLWSAAASPFAALLALSEWLYREFGRCHAINLIKLREAVARYLTEALGLSPAVVDCATAADRQDNGTA